MPRNVPWPRRCRACMAAPCPAPTWTPASWPPPRPRCSRPSRRGPRVRPRVRWIAPTALAASMVLAAGMAWHLRPLPVPAPASAPGSTEADGNRRCRRQDDRAAERDRRSGTGGASDHCARTNGGSRAIRPSRAANAPSNRLKSCRMPCLHRQAHHAPAHRASAGPSTTACPAAACTGKNGRRTGRFGAGVVPILDACHPELAPGDTGQRRRCAAARERACCGCQCRVALPQCPACAGQGGNGRCREAGIAKSARPAAAAQMQRNEAEMAADGGFVDAPGEDIPPATAASPAVRDAWLHRIGELLEQGKRQEADGQPRGIQAPLSERGVAAGAARARNRALSRRCGPRAVNMHP